MVNPSSTVTISDVMIGSKHPVRIMGILNVSQESFYKGSVITQMDDLEQAVSDMIAAGADIIDIGGASTAPRSIYRRDEIDSAKERERIVRALDTISSKIGKIPISIDTSAAEVAEVALDMGADLINDVTGLQGDDKMAPLVAERGVPVVIMADCRQECASIDTVMSSLRKSLEVARNSGIADDKIIIDPGIGFGKPTTVDLAILRGLRLFTYMRRPLLVGVSRKAFIGDILEIENPEGRLAGSLAATAIAVYNGANALRTHDVRDTLEVARIASTIQKERVDEV